MNYKESSALEKKANKDFIQQFFNERILFCSDYETNHDRGIDCYINGYAVDIKYDLPTKEWPEHEFCLEVKQQDGHTWLEHDENILILHWWFKEGKARPAFYKIRDLRLYLKMIEGGQLTWGFHYYRADTGTVGYYLSEALMQPIEDKTIIGKTLLI